MGRDCESHPFGCPGSPHPFIAGLGGVVGDAGHGGVGGGLDSDLRLQALFRASSATPLLVVGWPPRTPDSQFSRQCLRSPFSLVLCSSRLARSADRVDTRRGWRSFATYLSRLNDLSWCEEALPFDRGPRRVRINRRATRRRRKRDLSEDFTSFALGAPRQQPFARSGASERELRLLGAETE